MSLDQAHQSVVWPLQDIGTPREMVIMVIETRRLLRFRKGEGEEASHLEIVEALEHRGKSTIGKHVDSTHITFSRSCHVRFNKILRSAQFLD